MFVKKESLVICIDKTQDLVKLKRSDKRKAEDPLIEEKTTKRAALENITNSQSILKAKSSKNALVPKKSHQIPRKAEENLDINRRPAPKCTLPAGVECDIDLENCRDISQVPEYASDVFEYLKSRENHFKVEDYIERQANVTPSMRSILIDWLVSVQVQFKLDHETLYKAIKLVDIYLMKVALPSKNLLQLLGITSLLVASKYGEANPPTIGDCVYVCEDTYSPGDVVNMEVEILKAVGFELGIPDSYSFLRRYAVCARVTREVAFLSRYILEFSMMNYVLISFSESKMAAAALFIAMQNFDSESGWTSSMEYCSGYRLSDFKHIVIAMNDGMRKPFKRCQIITNKYRSKVFLKVARVPLKKTHELRF